MSTQLELPYIFSRRALVEEKMGQHSVTKDTIEDIRTAYQVLGETIATIPSDKIDQNHVTLTMIKPRIHKDVDVSRLPTTLLTGSVPQDEENLAHYLLSLLSTELQPLLTFSLNLTLSEIVMFYSSAIKRMEAEQPYNVHENDNFSNGADEFLSWLQSGPVTYSVLWDDDPQPGSGAVEKLIRANGRGLNRSWDVDDIKHHFPSAVRSLAIGNHNNLTHASASLSDVHNELYILSTILNARAGQFSG